VDVAVAEAAEVVAVAADVVRELVLLLLRPPEACLRSRQLPQLNAEITLHRRQRLAPITTRNCLFTLFRTEDFGC